MTTTTSRTQMAEALASVDRIQADNTYLWQTEMAALRDLAEAVRRHLAAPQTEADQYALGYVVLTYGLPPGQRPFAGFLLATRAEADKMAATAKTGPGERHVVAEVSAAEEDQDG